MKNILKAFLLTVPMLIIGCTNSVAEKVSEENNVTIKYKNSDTKLNQLYQSLYDISPSMLTSDIKENQVKWLKSRDKLCNTVNLSHPNNTKDMECFIEENNERIIELEKKYQSIDDIFNIHFKSIDNNYSPDFQTYCLCGVAIPYIDIKNKKLTAYTACDAENSNPSINDNITELNFDEIGRLEVTAVNTYGSEYKVAFEHKVDNIYMIVIEGKWGSITDLNLPEFVAPKDQNEIVTKNICGDFDG